MIHYISLSNLISLVTLLPVCVYESESERGERGEREGSTRENNFVHSKLLAGIHGAAIHGVWREREKLLAGIHGVERERGGGGRGEEEKK
jgi:hypothetical protein